MSRAFSVNGATFNFPETGDESWGSVVTNWAESVSNNTLQKTGGTFVLTSEIDFGASFGLRAVNYKSRAASIATAGILRLGNAESIGWRNGSNSANLTLLVNSSNQLIFNSSELIDASTSQVLKNKTLSSATLVNTTISGSISISSLGALEVAGNTVLGNSTSDTLTLNARLASDLIPTSTSQNLGSSSLRFDNLFITDISATGALILGSSSNATFGFLDSGVLKSVAGVLTSSKVTNTDILSSAGIVYSKLNLSSSIQTSDLDGAIISSAQIVSNAGILYSKLNLSSSILNSDLGEAITYANLNLSSSIQTSDFNGAVISNAQVISNAGILGSKIVPTFGSQNISTTGNLQAGQTTLSSLSAVTLSTGAISASSISALNLSASSTVQALKANVSATSAQLTADGDIGYDPAAGGFVGRTNGQVGPLGGDNSWTMQDSGSNQITLKSGQKNVNGIVTSIGTDIVTASTVQAVTNDTLTDLNSTSGMLYEASSTLRVYTFYDIVNSSFQGIANASNSSKWDYRTGDNSDFINAGISLARQVPLGYVDVFATGSPGTISYTIENFPPQAWTTFNNTAAAEPWEEWTPTLSTSAGTLSSTTFQTSKYRRVGAQVQFELSFTTTLSGAVTAYVGFNGPFDAANTGIGSIGGGYCNESSTNQQAVVQRFTDGTLRILDQDLSGFGTGSISVRVFGQYEIADSDAYQPLTVGFPNISDLVTKADITANTTISTENSETDITGASITLSPGVYQFYYGGTITLENTDGSTQVVRSRIRVTDSSNVAVPKTATYIQQELLTNSNVYLWNSLVSDPITVAEETTYKLRGIGSWGTSGEVVFRAADLGVFAGQDNDAYFFAKKVPQAGVGVLIPEATDTQGGTLGYYKKTTVDLTGSGTFTAGTLKLERINDQVTVTMTETPTFSSSSGPTSASGLIPTEFRPSLDVFNAYFLNTTDLWYMEVRSTGAFRLKFRDYTGSDAARTSASVAGSMSYSVGTD